MPKQPIAPWRIAILALAAALLVASVTVVPPAAIPPRAFTALLLTLAVVAMWATVAIPQPYASMLFLAAVLATGISSPRTVVSGFLSSTLFLVFGGLLIGLAAERSGFGAWVARKFLAPFRTSYSQLVLGILVGTSILSFLVPANMGRLAITVPIVLALARDAKYEIGSAGHAALVIAAVVGNFTVAISILPANLLNVMITGTGETLYGVRTSYLEYLLMCGPTLGIAKAALVWAVIVRMLPAPPPAALQAEGEPTLGPEARRVAMILALAITLWATDLWHGISPGLVALIAGALCVAPGFGVLPLSEAFDPRKLLILVWVGTVLSLGAILIDTGASSVVSHALSASLGIEGRSALAGHLAIAVSGSVLAALATIGGSVPIVVAAAGDIAAATGLALPTAILSVTVGLSALFFPFEAAPIVVGLAMGKVRQAVAARVMVVIAFATWVVIFPLNAAWWRVLGAIP